MTRTFGDFLDQWRDANFKPPRDRSVLDRYEEALRAIANGDAIRKSISREIHPNWFDGGFIEKGEKCFKEIPCNQNSLQADTSLPT